MVEIKRYNQLYNDLTENNKLIHTGLLLNRAYQKWPNNVAFICDNNFIDYKTLYYNVNKLAKFLLNSNIKKNDLVAILYENSIDFYIIYFAIWQIGAIVVPINIFLAENEIIKIIKNFKPKALIISDSFLNKYKNLIDLDTHIIKNLSKEFILSIDKEFEKFDFIEPVEKDIEDTTAILYTSGTTDFPKGVMLSSKNIIVNAIQAISRFESSEKDRIYCPLPLFHSLAQNTCIWTSIILGISSITISKIERHLIIESLKYKPSVIIAVPAVYGLFCKMKNINFGQIRYFVSGGDYLSDKIKEYFELIYRRKICNGYGLTETSPFIAVDIDDYTQPSNTVGIPFINIECQIRDENLNNLEKNKVGTLWVKGDNVMKGYYNLKQETQKVIIDNWFNTGDLAYINNDNKIILAGREKDLIKSKGIKIFPQEIENILLSHPHVIQAAVISEKNPENNEEYPIAYIATNYFDIDKLKLELLNLLQNNLAHYKLPRKFIIKKQLPVTATGKIDKKRLFQDKN